MGRCAQHSPTTCWMMTLIVRRGMSPQGTLFVALARHSFGGTDCRKCSMAGNNSTGSRRFLSRSCGILRANFHTHFSTSSATFASCESDDVPLAGNGLTIWSSSENSALLGRQCMLIDDGRKIALPENRHLPACCEKAEYDHIDEAGQVLHPRVGAVVGLKKA